MSNLHVQGTVWYLRGLNTQGDEHVRFGVMKWKPMHSVFADTFASQGVEFIPILGRGGGPLAEQVARAEAFIRQHPRWLNSPGPHHLLGHSTGGLVGRALLHHLEPRGKIISLTTLGTPHSGSPLAHETLRVPTERPLLHFALRSIGYDIRKKVAPFRDLTPEVVKEFALRYPEVPGVETAAPIFVVSPKELSAPVKILYHFTRGHQLLHESDGLVAKESQRFGRHLGEFRLDHLDQIGFNARFRQRNLAAKEFLRLCEELRAFWAQIELQSR